MARRRSQDDEIGPEIERLYALPPAAFTAARNELAARLRREGRRDAAVKVKALPRPTPSSWAVSRLMRLEPARFQALLAAGSQARQAQERVLRGGAALAGVPAARLREALATARQTLEELRRRGLELLAAAGKPPTAQTADRLAADLQALAFTAGAESAIARGWLDHDLEAPGFEVLAGLQAAAGRAGASPAARAAAASGPRPQGPGPHRQGPARQGPGPHRLQPGPSRSAPQPPPARASAAPRGEDEAAARRRQLETRRRAEQARREQARREQGRERARARLAAAEAEVERAAAESARLTAAAAAAEREAADARRRAEDAEREAERTRRASERASRLLEQARARLAAAHAAADRVTSSGAGQPSADETR